jgi:flagellar biosynthesis protein FlhB
VSEPNRTQAPTPKRVKDFRQRGDIALSRELVSVAALAGAGCALLACGGATMSALCELTRHAAMSIDGRDTTGIADAAATTFVKSVAPVLVVGAIAAAVAIMAQLGWPPARKKLGFDLAKLSPMANLRQAFSPAAMTKKTLTTIAKILAVGVVVVLAVRPAIGAPQMGAGELAAFAAEIGGRALPAVMALLALLAAVDYFLARRRMATQMKMSPDEIKREHRESDGDPHVKGRRRQRMRELAMRRLQVAVAKADVVIVNPTHYSVALRYDDTSDAAPVVVAKGVDEVAARIREIARQNGVPVLSRPPLARALHAAVKEGRAVPVNLYRAVAEVLAYVYRLRRGGVA